MIGLILSSIYSIYFTPIEILIFLEQCLSSGSNGGRLDAKA